MVYAGEVQGSCKPKPSFAYGPVAIGARHDINQVQDKVFGISAAFQSGSCYASVAGNHDGMLLSAGILQWCIGMATLQPCSRK